MLSHVVCPAEDGWERTPGDSVASRACGSNVEYRYCGMDGTWGAIDSSQCKCPALEHFRETSYGETNSDNHCDNGVVVRRTCSNEGVWELPAYDDLCSRRGVSCERQSARRSPAGTRAWWATSGRRSARSA